MTKRQEKLIENYIRTKVQSMLKEESARNPEHIRKYAPGIVGPDFAKVADDEDILKMTEFQAQLAKIHNYEILPIKKEIDSLRAKYKLKKQLK